jgi:hypothetical protein
MNRPLVVRLIQKDWYLNRGALALILSGGALGVAVLYMRSEVSGFVGLSTALIATIFLGILLPMQTVVNERKKQNLAFVMSLPISQTEYTFAKMAANLIAFVAVWLPIAGAAVGTIAGTGRFGGLIPVMVIAALSPFVAFCLLLATAVVVESETWAVVVMGACNVSYSFSWYFLIRIPAVREQMASPVATWSPLILRIIGVEIGIIVVSIALTFFLQSRKRDFV